MLGSSLRILQALQPFQVLAIKFFLSSASRQAGGLRVSPLCILCCSFVTPSTFFPASQFHCELYHSIISPVTFPDAPIYWLMGSSTLPFFNTFLASVDSLIHFFKNTAFFQVCSTLIPLCFLSWCPSWPSGPRDTTCYWTSTSVTVTTSTTTTSP